MGNMSGLAESPVLAAIAGYWERKGAVDEPRRYLGASAIGHECDKYLWLSFRGVVRERFEPRMHRLFNRGHREEEVFVEELRGAGCEVWPVDPETGAQWAVTALGGHFSGHLDGMGMGIPGAEKSPHVLEFKTHGDSSFSKLEKEGVKVAKPQHWAQMQVYMGLTKVDRALYLAVNKNTDALWAERIHYDASEFKRIMARAQRIIEGNDAERCATRPDDWRCKFCAAHAVCWRETKTVFLRDSRCPVDCRSCCHATPATDAPGARWLCGLDMGCVVGGACKCGEHIALPALIDGEPVRATDDERGVVYLVGGREIVNGPGGWSTEELAISPKDVVTNEGVNAAKATFAGTVAEVKPPLLERYPPGDSELVWSGSAADVNAHVPPGKITDQEERDGTYYVEIDGQWMVANNPGNGTACVMKGKE